MMSEQEIREMLAYWEAPGSLHAPEGEDDAAAIDGIYPLPGMTIAELIR